MHGDKLILSKFVIIILFSNYTKILESYSHPNFGLRVVLFQLCFYSSLWLCFSGNKDLALPTRCVDFSNVHRCFFQNTHFFWF